jgi:hypothetical protein
MGVVNETIQDRVGESRTAKHRMLPLFLIG